MVSVIVRTKNEEKHIGYCIQSLTDFIGKPEIIIVDNESTRIQDIYHPEVGSLQD